MPTQTYQDQAHEKFQEGVVSNECTKDGYYSPLPGLSCYCKNKSE